MARNKKQDAEASIGNNVATKQIEAEKFLESIVAVEINTLAPTLFGTAK